MRITEDIDILGNHISTGVGYDHMRNMIYIYISMYIPNNSIRNNSLEYYKDTNHQSWIWGWVKLPIVTIVHHIWGN